MIPAASPIVGPEERAAVDAVMASGGLAQGPQVAAFEREFSAIVGELRVRGGELRHFRPAPGPACPGRGSW